MIGFALSLLVLAAASASASAAKPKATPPAFRHGAVFTETNTVPNFVLAFNRSASGRLTLQGKYATGGNGQPTGNPPAGFDTLDSSGAVILGRSSTCLFAVNAASSTVSAFRLTTKGLKLANHLSSGGQRPVSLTSTVEGSSGKVLLYVLNSTTSDATIHGYTVAPNCRLSNIRGSTRPTSSRDSLPAQISFDIHGKVLAVSERFANKGAGDFDVFPVNRNGTVGPPVVTPSAQRTPYGMSWNKNDLLAVSNEDFPPPAVANSTVTTYTLNKNGKLVAQFTAPSAGAACWQTYTSNGKFLFSSNPGGPLFGGNNIISFKVGPNGRLTAVARGDTPYNSLDVELSRDNKYLYTDSDMTLPVSGPHSAITAFRVNAATGGFAQIAVYQLANGNSTSGLAVF